MDAVALAAVITSGVVGLTGASAAFWIDKLKRMLDELLPEEAAARKLMAEAMAKDLGHR